MLQFKALIELFNKFFPVVIGAVIVFLYLQWQHAKEESQRWEQNAKSNVDYLTRGEFKDSAKAWGVNPKGVKEVTKITSTTTTLIKTPVYDTIINEIPVHCVNWSNGYTTLNGCFETGAKLTHRDTLNAILKRVPTKKFLFIRYAKIDSLVIQNKDSNSKYTVSRIVRDKKFRK
jgi:hypothetical protein